MTTQPLSPPRFKLGDTMIQLLIDGGVACAVTVVELVEENGTFVKVITTGFYKCFDRLEWLLDGSPSSLIFRIGKMAIVKPRHEHAAVVAAYEAQCAIKGRPVAFTMPFTGEST